MEKDDIMNQVKAVIAERLGAEIDKVNEGTSFVDDLGADSLDIVELVMDLEEKFSVEIPDEDAEKIATVGNAVDYIISKR